MLVVIPYSCGGHAPFYPSHRDVSKAQALYFVKARCLSVLVLKKLFFKDHAPTLNAQGGYPL